MPLKQKQINTFLFLKLPSAFFCGVRLKSIDDLTCCTTVKYRWINQNPFKSMFWAVQGMAAELSTGALVMSYIKESNQRISMLVANNRATFLKKATGRITFTCVDGHLLKETMDRAIKTDEGQTCWMRSEGMDSQGNIVSKFEFEWTLKVK